MSPTTAPCPVVIDCAPWTIRPAGKVCYIDVTADSHSTIRCLRGDLRRAKIESDWIAQDLKVHATAETVLAVMVAKDYGVEIAPTAPRMYGFGTPLKTITCTPGPWPVGGCLTDAERTPAPMSPEHVAHVLTHEDEYCGQTVADAVALGDDNRYEDEPDDDLYLILDANNNVVDEVVGNEAATAAATRPGCRVVPASEDAVDEGEIQDAQTWHSETTELL